MNCSYEQCAPINEAQCWSNIDWKAAKRYVGSLQARIVKAVKQGRKGKVKSLQWLLTHSFYAKALAVKPEFNCEVRHSSISSSQCHFFKYNRWLLEA